MEDIKRVTARIITHFHCAAIVFVALAIITVAVHLFGATRAHITKREARLIGLFNNLTCFNQGKFLEYYLVASNKHRDLRIALASGNKNRDENTLALVKGLIDFLNGEYESVVQENFSYAAKFLEITGRRKPRISLKGNTRDNKENKIIEIFGSSAVNYQTESRIGENSCLESIWKNGLVAQIVRGIHCMNPA